MMLTLVLTYGLIISGFSMTPEPTGRWLVEVNSSQENCLTEWIESQPDRTTDFVLEKMPIGQWWVIEIPERFEVSVRSLSCIARMMPDRRIMWRKQPNDPAYINQPDMNLIGMTKAWDFTTGGLTATGDTIVVALIDDGYQLDHPDLMPNIRINYGEISDDQMDNDGNGYVDDRLGYNVSSENDHHDLRTHGTSVAGIVGARGNNGIGVSGVNWNVKLLLVSGGDFESQVILAYQYVLDMRERYDESGGADGAFVVATNLSGGINYAWADDHPLWCEMYDKLGQRGILSVTAAPNDPISVDEFGDMPTTCTSEYMIAVTNVDPSDNIMGNAGYGLESIDIGAPGEGTFTTAQGNQYKSFPGTSAAAPHVAGAIGLIYSTPCEDIIHEVHDDPAGTAIRIKNLIYSTAKSNISLEEITVTGRRLQVDAAIKKTLEDCGLSGEGSINITSVRPNPVIAPEVQVHFEYAGDITEAFYELFSANGSKMLESTVSFEEIEQGYFTIRTDFLPSAVYMVTLRFGDKKMTRKFLVP